MATLTVALAFACGLFSVAEGIPCGQPGRLACFSSTLLLQSRAVQCPKLTVHVETFPSVLGVSCLHAYKCRLLNAAVHRQRASKLAERCMRCRPLGLECCDTPLPAVTRVDMHTDNEDWSFAAGVAVCSNGMVPDEQYKCVDAGHNCGIDGHPSCKGAPHTATSCCKTCH